MKKIIEAINKIKRDLSVSSIKVRTKYISYYIVDNEIHAVPGFFPLPEEEIVFTTSGYSLVVCFGCDLKSVEHYVIPSKEVEQLVEILTYLPLPNYIKRKTKNKNLKVRLL